jgi:class 3 adenylate cyclase
VWHTWRVTAPPGTVTFLFTDIEGSTPLWQLDEAGMGVAVRRHDELLRAAVIEGDGVFSSTMGDGFAAAFAAPAQRYAQHSGLSPSLSG